MYRVVVLLLFCLTIVSSLPEYFTAFKYEKLLIGKETKCFISRYEFKTKIVQNDTGEDFSNYLPTEMYDSPCYSDYKHNEMNFIRDENNTFYLVHCLFFPDAKGKVVCDMFNEDGYRRIVDVECNITLSYYFQPRGNSSFYIADYLTGKNPNEFLYGDSIMYTEENLIIPLHDPEKNDLAYVCGKQIGYVRFDTVIDGFLNEGYSYWDSYLSEGYNFETPGKRLLFRGKNHLISIEEGLLKYGNLNEALRVYISKAEYDIFINLDLTDYSFIFPKQKHDGLIIGNNTDEGFMITSTNESFPQMEYYTDIYENYFPGNSSDNSSGNYEYYWDREKRQFVLIRFKKVYNVSTNNPANISVTVKIPGFDVSKTKDFLSSFVYSEQNFVKTDKLKAFLHPNFKFHVEKHEDDLHSFVLSLESEDAYHTVYTNSDLFIDAVLFHCMAFDPVKNQYLQFVQPNFTVKPFDGKTLEPNDYSTGSSYKKCGGATSTIFFGRYPIMRTNVGLNDDDDYTWLSVYGDGKYDDVLKKYKPRYAFEEIIFYKFISQQILPTSK